MRHETSLKSSFKVLIRRKRKVSEFQWTIIQREKLAHVQTTVSRRKLYTRHFCLHSNYCLYDPVPPIFPDTLRAASFENPTRVPSFLSFVETLENAIRSIASTSISSRFVQTRTWRRSRVTRVFSETYSGKTSSCYVPGQWEGFPIRVE